MNRYLAFAVLAVLVFGTTGAVAQPVGCSPMAGQNPQGTSLYNPIGVSKSSVEAIEGPKRYPALPTGRDGQP